MAEQRLIIITGSTNGIGKATLERLQRSHPDCTIVGTYKGDNPPEEIERVKYIRLNLLDFNSIKTFIVELRSFMAERNFNKISCFINNAGMRGTRSTINFGNNNEFNKCFFVNLLSTYVLTKEVLTNFETCRVISMGSVKHWRANDDLDVNSRADVSRFYDNSKLGVFFMSQSLSEEFHGEESPNRANANTNFCVCNPGFVASNIWRDVTFMERMMTGVRHLLALCPDESSELIVNVALKAFDEEDREIRYYSQPYDIPLTHTLASYVYTGMYELNDAFGRYTKFLSGDKADDAITCPSDNTKNADYFTKYMDEMSKTYQLFKDDAVSL